MTELEELNQCVGLTVRSVSEDRDDPSVDGSVTLEFTNGSRLRVVGCWCNNSTGDVAVYFHVGPDGGPDA